jgi:plasmid maintenance system antidote protein VapI
MAEPVVIEHEGKPTHVVVPWAEWQRIRRALAAAEDAADAAEAAAVLADPATEYVPGEVVHRIARGEPPLRVWREHRGLSEAALGERAGLPPVTVAAIERGTRRATPDQLRRLARALDVSVDDLAIAMTEGSG